MKVTYNPQPGDPTVIYNHGVTLTAGKAVDVPDDHDLFRRLRLCHAPLLSGLAEPSVASVAEPSSKRTLNGM